MNNKGVVKKAATNQPQRAFGNGLAKVMWRYTTHMNLTRRQAGDHCFKTHLVTQRTIQDALDQMGHNLDSYNRECCHTEVTLDP